MNQAGAIGAIGATIMGGYRLTAGRRSAFLPAVIAIVSIVEILVVLANYDINVKNITSAEDVRGIALAPWWAPSGCLSPSSGACGGGPMPSRTPSRAVMIETREDHLDGPSSS